MIISIIDSSADYFPDQLINNGYHHTTGPQMYCLKLASFVQPTAQNPQKSFDEYAFFATNT